MLLVVKRDLRMRDLDVASPVKASLGTLDTVDHAESACIGFDFLFHGSFLFKKGKVGLCKKKKSCPCFLFFFSLSRHTEKSPGLDVGRKKY